MGIILTPAFRRRLNKKTPDLAARVLECVDKVGDDPHAPGLHTHRMAGTDGVWEAYVDQANRVTFHYEGGDIVFRSHCNHDMLRRP